MHLDCLRAATILSHAELSFHEQGAPLPIPSAHKKCRRVKKEGGEPSSGSTVDAQTICAGAGVGKWGSVFFDLLEVDYSALAVWAGASGESA